MKKVFESPVLELIRFDAEVLTVDHQSEGDGDVNKNWDEIE